MRRDLKPYSGTKRVTPTTKGSLTHWPIGCVTLSLFKKNSRARTKVGADTRKISFILLLEDNKMSIDPDEAATRRDRIQSAISQVRGRAETSGGAVIIESDMHGKIIDLQISQSAMSVDPARLSRAIMQCHEVATERAESAARQLFEELRDSKDLPPQTARSNNSQEWEQQPSSLRITHSV
ncbi:YbaB/EbfC family DNA-binding protein [Nocardia yunnanensis]|uniref:YbaB/EbfC family DNA-binding protein n=2 Tax=Nocardia yunnanensis TaxID=2382165 RepID=A0A386ZM75_9NOCA|nr:YbaB/EbfC family DNA-binding protein [Nocardia yunnanensis]